MGNTTNKIKEGIKDTARAVKRGAEKAKDAAVRGVDKSKDAAARTAEKVSSYQRSTFIEKGGWDKMPGEEKAGSTVARACADGLAVLMKK